MFVLLSHCETANGIYGIYCGNMNVDDYPMKTDLCETRCKIISCCWSISCLSMRYDTELH